MQKGKREKKRKGGKEGVWNTYLYSQKFVLNYGLDEAL